MRKIFIQICTVFGIFLLSQSTLALTDPEPNPFAALEDGESVYAGTVAAITEEVLTFKNELGIEFLGQPETMLRYREGGGPAELSEFAVGDRVRFIGSESGVAAVQNYELKLCDQNFYGRVREPTNLGFRLETVAGENFAVRLGLSSQFKSEDGELLFGYRPRAGDVVRVHGVFNTNSKQVFTETLGAYITLLSEEALAPLLAEVEEARVHEKDADESAAEEFHDLAAEHRYRRAVGFVRREGIVSGYPDGSFRPDGPINRAEFTKILIEAKFSTDLSAEQTEGCFPDFETSAWFARYVCLAKVKAVLGGYPDGSFRPGNEVNLAEALKIIVAAFGWTVDLVAEDEEWYAPYLAKAEKLQILPAELSEPGVALTRGEMAELILRAVKYERGELVDYLAEPAATSSN
jgi:hypothetical protein